MPTSAKQNDPLKYWFLAQCLLLALLVGTLTVSSVLGLKANREQHHNRISQDLQRPKAAIHELAVPHGVSQFFASYEEEISSDEDRAKLKQHMEKIASEGGLQELVLCFDDLRGTQEQLIDVFAPLKELTDLRNFRSRSNVPNLVLEALPFLPHLNSLTLHDTRQDWLHPSSLQRIDGKYVDDPAIPLSLSEVSKFLELEELSIPSTSVKDNDFTALATLKKLKKVDAVRLRVTGSQLHPLAAHPALEVFDCCLGQEDDEMFKVFGSCPNMETIDAYGSRVTDEGLAYLSSLTNLEELRLSRTKISDAGFSHLRDCKSLTSIDCDYCNLTDAIGPVLSQLPKLRRLNSSNTKTTAKLLKYLESNKEIVNIFVGDQRIHIDDLVAFFKNRITPATFEIGIPARKNFESPVSNSWTSALCHFCNLYDSTYNIRGYNLTGIQGLNERLETLLPTQTTSCLVLENTDIDDSDLKMLSSSFHLSTLNIAVTVCTAAGLGNLKGQSSLTDLTIGPIDDTDLAMQVVSSLTALETFKFRGPQMLTVSGISALHNMMRLTRIEFPDIELDAQRAKELCQLPHLERIVSKKLDWGREQIYRYRTQ